MYWSYSSEQIIKSIILKILLVPLAYICAGIIILGFFQSGKNYLQACLKNPFNFPFHNISEENKNGFLSGLKKMVLGLIALIVLTQIFQYLEKGNFYFLQ